MLNVKFPHIQSHSGQHGLRENIMLNNLPVESEAFDDLWGAFP